MNLYLDFASKNLLFSISIALVSFVLGWLLYSGYVLKKIDLKHALFEKDNVAAWIEFIGAFIFPTLYLSAQAVQGSASDKISLDLIICIGYAVLFILIFTVLRLLSGALVNSMSPPDVNGKIKLNNEIYNEKNIAAALFSVSLSIIFVIIIAILDISSFDNFITSILKMSVVLIFTLLAIIGYCMILRHKTSLFKEIFLDNNPAAGFSFAGFVFGVGLLLNNLVRLQAEFDFFELIILSGLSLIILGIVSIVLKWVFAKVIKVDIWKEVYEQNSFGAAIGQVALYIGIANIIVNYIK
jgi:hypothetical protein